MEMDTVCNESAVLEIQRLQDDRRQLEEQIKNTRELLDAYNVGMNGTLVDAEGFPRPDVDIYNVRHKRVEVIRAENDYKCLMKKLEQSLIQYHHNIRSKVEDLSGRPPTLSNDNPEKLAHVNEVRDGSPSFVAGMRKGDIIIEFGSVNSSNFRGLNSINNEVEKSINSYIKVIVEREGQLKRFNLKPRVWEGNGYLGCLLLRI